MNDLLGAVKVPAIWQACTRGLQLALLGSSRDVGGSPQPDARGTA